MDSFIHADIFFFVTTISVGVLTILLIIAWIYLMKILANMRKLSDKARVEGEFLIGALHEFGCRVRSEQTGFRAIFRFMRRIIGRYS